MTNSTSLLDLLLSLLRDPSALAAYQEDPDGFLATCGDVSPDDIRDALVLLQDNQDADFNRDYNTGGNHVHVPPPPAHNPEPGESDHDASIRYLNTYITNNNIDDRDTIVDNSVNQQIDTGGGDFDQDIDIDSTVASGDGAVAAGDDIEDSTITTGDDNQVGDDNVRGDGNVVGDDNNAVTGNGNTSSFGDGDATSTEIDGDVSVGDGGSFASGGDSTVDNTDNSLENVDNDYSDNSQDNVDNDNSEHSLDNLGNDYSDNSDNSDHSIEDSLNDNSDSSDHSDTSVHDSSHVVS
jgi:hypothetical protein